MKRLLIFIINHCVSISFRRKLFKLLSSSVLRNKSIGHFEPSIIYSKEDINTTPGLIELIADATKIASKISLDCGKKNLADSKFLNIFPGEHYRLLNALVKTSKSKKIVEIGTYTGMGSLALKTGLPNVTVTTFDIIPWDKLGIPSHFDVSDFDETLHQIVGDLSEDEVFRKYMDVLNEADIIFMDAPKDDKFEYKMAEKFIKLNKKEFKLLILDDIQFVNMIDFWRKIKSPKLDITSFGHFSGTGIVDISNGFNWG